MIILVDVYKVKILIEETALISTRFLLYRGHLKSHPVVIQSMEIDDRKSNRYNDLIDFDWYQSIDEQSIAFEH